MRNRGPPSSRYARFLSILFFIILGERAWGFVRHSSSLDSSQSRRESSTRLYGPVMVDDSTSGSRSFRTSNPVTGDHLVGVVTVKDPASREICVLCHGLLGSKDNGIIKKLGEGLPANTCRFDFSGNGESEGSFRYSGYETEVQDLRAVIEALRADGWNVTAILGHSKGAHIVLRYSWTFDDMPKVISLSGRFDFSRQPKTRFTQEQMTDLEEKGEFIWTVRGKDYVVRKADYNERGNVDMSAVSGIKRSHVLVLHGDQDETIPVEDAGALAAALPNSSVRILKGASHFFLTPEEVEAVVSAVAEYLQAPPPQTCASSS